MIKQILIVPSVIVVLLSFANFSNSNISETDKTDSIIVDGLKRTWLIHIPPSYDKTKSMPLLIALHGGGGTGRNMLNLTMGSFDTIANKKGFFVVYPDGIEKYWNDGRNSKEIRYWTQREKIDDVGFISALIDHLIKEMNIDPKKVYVTGMSNGAIMTYRLACELSEKITAIAPVAGNIPENIQFSCSPSRSVSVLAINGVNDPLVPFEGGDVTGPYGLKRLGKVLSARESVLFWANKNNCSGTPIITYEPDIKPHDGTRVKKEAYTNGNNDTEVVLYAIEGGGHTWPGGMQYLGEKIIGKTCMDINASQVICDFFEKHSSK
jgi:polyhydroxybutyrate depolymerase